MPGGCLGSATAASPSLSPAQPLPPRAPTPRGSSKGQPQSRETQPSPCFAGPPAPSSQQGRIKAKTAHFLSQKTQLFHEAALPPASLHRWERVCSLPSGRFSGCSAEHLPPSSAQPGTEGFGKGCRHPSGIFATSENHEKRWRWWDQQPPLPPALAKTHPALPVLQRREAATPLPPLRLNERPVINTLAQIKPDRSQAVKLAAPQHVLNDSPV